MREVFCPDGFAPAVVAIGVITGEVPADREVVGAAIGTALELYPDGFAGGGVAQRDHLSFRSQGQYGWWL